MFDKIDVSDLKYSSVNSYLKNINNNDYECVFDSEEDNLELDVVKDGSNTTSNPILKNTDKGLNGEIDEAVYQGEIGDCWLVSAVLSMSYTDDGADVIKNNMFINDDGSVVVSFPGADKEYAVTSDEIAKENVISITGKTEYSKGDDDMLALELAVEKIVDDKSVKTNYSLEDGGNPYYIFKLFDADNIKVASSKSEIKQALSYYEKNSDKCSMTLGVVDESVCGLLANHGYAVKSIDEDNIVLINPWDSTTEIKVDRDELISNSNNISIVYAEFESASKKTETTEDSTLTEKNDSKTSSSSYSSLVEKILNKTNSNSTESEPVIKEDTKKETSEIKPLTQDLPQNSETSEETGSLVSRILDKMK